jgi:hypothetical protein
MRPLVHLLFVVALQPLGSVAVAAGTSEGGERLALAACADQTAGKGERSAKELGQYDMDKGSTVAAADLIREYRDFHDQAQAATGVRAALMPWSDLATHSN